MEKTSSSPLCKLCGEEIVNARANAKFCDKDHYLPCKECGEDYLVKKVVAPPEFCSAACGAKHRNKTPKTKKCRLCGDSFTATNANARYCAKDHYKTCLTCGEEFLVTNPSRLKEYCSHKCSLLAPKEERLCKRCGLPYAPTSARSEYCQRDHYSSCEYCGVKILLKNLKRLTRYCSSSCSSKDRTYTLSCLECGEAFESKKADAKYCERGHKATCEHCGTSFIRTSKPYPSSHGARTCSQECAIEITDYESRNKKGVKTLLERYGVTNAFLLPGASDSSPARVSKLNHRWKETLESALGATFTLEEKFGTFYADLVCGDVLIDVNPTVTHNSTKSFPHLLKRCTIDGCRKPSHEPREASYHQDRFLSAEVAGKTLLQYFDWMDKDIFTSVVRAKLHLDENKAPARQCELRKISQKDANSFLRVNHLLGPARGQTFCVGLFFDGELVHVNTYGPARLNKRFEWEAIRSCSKMNWHVQGGLQRADAFFKRGASPESIVSYVDLALGGGGAESQNPGWALVATNKPSATWCYLGETAARQGKPLFVKDASARRISADRLLGLEVGGKYPSHHSDGSVFTNSDVLLMEGYLQVFDAGTRTFGWHSPAS